MAQKWIDQELRVQAMQFAVAVYSGGINDDGFINDDSLIYTANRIYWFLLGDVDENMPADSEDANDALPFS